MARHSEGWTLRLPKGRTIWLVYFTHEKRTVERSTGERDRGAASKRAAEIYGETVTGRVAPRVVSGDLTNAMASWLGEYERTHTPETAKCVEGYVNGFLAFFGGFDRLTTSGFGEYLRTRLGKVTRSTLRKEMSALRQFAAWLEADRGLKLPPVPSVPKGGHGGTRSAHARRRVATVLAPEEVAAILAAMPVKAPRSGAWLRPFFIVCWETALRPYSTIAKLTAPLHYRRGAAGLFIGREVDKTDFERTVPLSTAAKEALDLVCPKGHKGALFPHVDKNAMRVSLAAAVAKAGIDRPVSIYDIRHSRLSHLANSGAPLAGVSFLAGHKRIATTSIYVQSNALAAAAALGAVGAVAASESAGRPSKAARER